MATKKRGGSGGGLAVLGGLLGTVAYKTGHVPEVTLTLLVLLMLMLAVDAFGSRTQSPLFRTLGGSIATWTVLRG